MNRNNTVRTGRELTKNEKKEIVAQRKEEHWQHGYERARGGVDRIMLAIILLLLTTGAVMMYSASYPTAIIKTNGADGLFYLKKHLLYMAIGGVGMAFSTFTPIRWYKRWLPIGVYALAILMLLAVLVIGTSEGDAKRWIYIGSFSIQPSEIMKVSLVLMLAWYIDKYKKDIDRRPLNSLRKFWVGEMVPLIFVGVACFLIILERHLSGTIIVCALGIAVMAVGGCHKRWTFGLTAAAGAVGGGLFLLMNSYAWKRIATFTSDNADNLGERWQTNQGILAIGSGGLLGVGFSESRQKFSYVSMAHNDFIYTIWCEELGFVGAVLLVALFLLFVWRGYVIASRAPDTFTMLSVFGITTQVGLQAVLNMMVVCDIIPNTGISLPFFSYGGSSLIMLMVEMGFILAVSRQFYRKKQL